MNKITVNLGQNSYDIFVGIDILSDFSSFVEKKGIGDKFVVITDPNVKKLWGRTIGSKFPVLTVPRGEKYKNLKMADKLFGRLADMSVHRDSCIIALGGGVIGDLASFVAATYMRGVCYVQVPTTLLAQVDSSIGGKTGVNHAKGKNLIGAYKQPRFVYTDVSTIKTLPERELKTGLAEVVKYGIIYDYDLFKFVEANVHHLNTKVLPAALKVWQRIITESASIKAKVVAEDEKENGIRMILNFGHTIGHAIELLTKYKKFNHGEAVSIGMWAAARIAVKIGILDQSQGDRIKALLEKIGLPISVDLPTSDIIESLNIDKKVRGGKVQFVLPTAIGRVEIRSDIEQSAIKDALKDIGCK